MPTARLGLSTSVVNGQIYAIGGGRSVDGPHSRIVEQYDAVTDTWTSRTDMPTGRIGHGAGVIDGKIYVIGGDLSARVSGATVEQYDVATDAWMTKADMPTKRTFLCACAVSGKIYAIGGIAAPSMHTLSTVEEYDPASDTWTTKTDMPTPRHTAAASVVNGKIYVLGGWRDTSLRIIEEYDPATDTWTRKANMPTGRIGLSTSVVAGKIYAMGGASGETGQVFKTVEEYDPEADTWTSRADMPTATCFSSTSAVDRKIYAVGGSVRYPPYNSSVSTVEEYDLTGAPPDFNGDGRVDGKDVLILAECWGQDDAMCDIAPPPFGNCIVDLEDLVALADYIGKELNDPTLIAHWALDEAEGDIACDSAGENDGTILGVPRWQPDAGQAGGALEFDGTCFVVADAALNPAGGPFSVLAWVQGGGPSQAIVSQQRGANWLLADALDGSLMTDLRAGGRSPVSLCSQAVISDGDWHRVGFTWDGASRRLYVDDVLVAEDTQNVLAGSPGKQMIGCGANMTSDTFWIGLIDDVRIYNRALRP